MHARYLAAWAPLALFLGTAGFASEPAETGSVRGEYLEARNADVWTGPCFANGEMGIVGNKAVLAWKVGEGSRGGARLDGLGIAAVVIGDGTFGMGNKVTTRTLLLVDERADKAQRAALVGMARELASDTIQTVTEIKAVPFELETAYCDGLGCARLKAGDAEVRTRCLCAKDSICGHEEMSYPAMARVESPYAAYTLTNSFKGKELGETFRDNNARSAIIANFGL